MTVMPVFDRQGRFSPLKAAILLAVLLPGLWIGWRLANPAPPMPGTMKDWEKLLARGIHILFYVALIAMPLTGWLASSASGRDISWFGLFNWPLLPIEGGRAVSRQLMDVHELVMKGMYALVALHVLAALKHQFIDTDNVLHRMIPWIPRRDQVG